MEEMQYVERARVGDQEALDYLVAKWQPRLVAHFRRKNAGSDAEDIAQNVMLTMIRNISGLREPAAFRAWLYKTAANELASFYRHNDKTQRLEEGMGHVHASGARRGRTGAAQIRTNDYDVTMQDVMKHENVGAVNDAIDLLPELYRDRAYGEKVRDVLVRFMDGEKMREIAEDLSIPLGSIKRMISIAREKLAEVLNISASEDLT